MPDSVASVLSDLIVSHSILAQALSFRSLCLFTDLVAYLKPSLLWSQSPYKFSPPSTLPDNLQEFLSAALDISLPLCAELWSLLRDVLWTMPPLDSRLSGTMVDLLLEHGVGHGIGVYNFYPPTRHCLRDGCTYIRRHTGDQRVLEQPIPTNVVYFSREHGPLPSVCHSMRCPRCHTRYYPNYYTDKAGDTRTYYGGLPNAIHATTHVFIDTALCDRFTNSSACAWVSFTNNARIYNLEHHAAIQRFPSGWSAVHPELSTVHVSDVFFIYGLLRDRARRASTLVLSSSGDQSARLDPQLRARTAAFVGPGRDGWNHICDKCCSVKKDGDNYYVMRAVVMDGITIGRPCCGVHDCKEPLPSQRARYCRKHSGMDAFCVVVGCTAHASPGFQTCPEPTHRSLEDTSGRSALFILRRRLERLRASAVEDDGSGTTDELIDIDADGECPSKPDSGNTKPRARFGRRRTHNEQLIVATCGTILARATMFGSEGVDGTRVLLHVAFPEDSLPEVVFFDNACRLKQHLISMGDHYFDKCAMPVDPFHAKTKHKDSDTFCGTHCNAALFPDLLDGDRWRFNSSAAEMTNAWVGGFQAMVREMREARYDFFLDEVMRIRNLIIADDLKKAGAHPVLLPRELLLHRTLNVL